MPASIYYTAIDEFSRLRFLAAYPKQFTYSPADFLKRLVKRYFRRGIKAECVQIDNGFEFTNCHANNLPMRPLNWFSPSQFIV